MTVPLGEVVRRAGTLGFALAREREGEVSSMSESAFSSLSGSSFLILRGEIHDDVTSVFVVVIVAGESTPRLRFREESGGVRASSISGVAEADSFLDQHSLPSPRRFHRNPMRTTQETLRLCFE